MAAGGLVGWLSGRSVEGQDPGSGRLRSSPDIHLSPCPQPKPQELQVGFEEELKFFPPVTEFRDPNFCSSPYERAPTVLSSSVNWILSCYSFYSLSGFMVTIPFDLKPTIAPATSPPGTGSMNVSHLIFSIAPQAGGCCYFR